MYVPEYLKDSKEVRYMDTINIDLSKMSQIDWRLLSSTLYNAIKKFYENPENLRRFEEWQKKRGEQLK